MRDGVKPPELCPIEVVVSPIGHRVAGSMKSVGLVDALKCREAIADYSQSRLAMFGM